MPLTLHAQDRYFTRTGHIDFFSHTPIEDIKAVNEQVTSFLGIETGEVVFAVLMNSFEFEKALMQEHFNENYVESEQYPRSSFKGYIVNMKEVDFKTSGQYAVKVKGDLTMHGVTQVIETDGILDVQPGKIGARSTFNIKPEDYKIKIPAAVRNKIASEVQVNVMIDYVPYTN